MWIGRLLGCSFGNVIGYIVERHVVEIDAIGDVIVLGRFGIAGFGFRMRRFAGRLTRLLTVVARLCVGLVVFGVENGLASSVSSQSR